MEWLTRLFSESSGAAHAILVIGIAAAAGLALGALRVGGVQVGVAGVLFAGLLLGHFGIKVEHEVLEFAREFGLILFVYSIGLQVGPGFVASLRKQGMSLNLLAAGVVLMGVVLTVILYKAVLPAEDRSVAVGIFAGATTNTPSLAAAQQAIRDLGGPGAVESAKLPGLGYAVSYPFGIAGVLLSMLLLKRLFQVNLETEKRAWGEANKGPAPLETMNIRITNANLDGLCLADLPIATDWGVVISRIRQGEQTRTASGDVVLRLGDVLLAVGPPRGLEKLRIAVGDRSDVDLKVIPSDLVSRPMLVTQKEALGRSVAELNLEQRFGVTITRIQRGEVELPARSVARLQFADSLLAVGTEQGLKEAAAVVGNSPKRLNHPQIVPVFVGIALGVILGSVPFTVPGIPAPVRLGLAGGPLLVAIVLSRVGHVGSLVWHMPNSANFLMREIGIAMFLACVGINAGDKFVPALVAGRGFVWMACGAAITVLPLLIVGAVARKMVELNFLSLCGLLAGSMTDPPALAFAGGLTQSDSPGIAYAAVYPLVMVLRVLAAQAMVIALGS